MATPVTRDHSRSNPDPPNEILNLATPLDTIRPTEVDLGDRSLIIVPRRGHTASDVTIEISDPSVVFCGDLSQVDNPYISPYGGMAALIEKFKDTSLFAHVTLERSVRSPLAEMAATIL